MYQFEIREFQNTKLCKLGMFWNPQELFLKMGTEILKIDASQTE